ncbi:MAG: radical SAM protein [Elusimicrobia bacterium RIFOXYA2_FULL_39_19]|nr:MAG: radical SAM protein [Elusimicrobia bacterium RIFOXYA2_FULL_39_19]
MKYENLKLPATKPENYLELKASLLVEGVNADRQSMKGLGVSFKEQRHGLFGWDFDDHAGTLLPDDFTLPDGTVVQFRMKNDAPYKIKQKNNKRLLYKNEIEICEVNWLRRPEFYNKKTSQGYNMPEIGQVGGEDCLFFCYQNYCSHFSKNKQCLFCNLVSTSKTYNSVLKKKTIEAIGEVAGEAWKEGMARHVLITGGCTTAENETKQVTAIVQSILKHTGLKKLPGTVLPSPAKGDSIKAYHDSGIAAIGYSMEIWDERLYSAVCPGKAENTSHKEFIESIESAVKIFGEGNVYGVFVMGIEPKESFLEGVRVISGLGANVVPFVWSPNPGSKYEGHRAPAPKWYYDTIMEAAAIVKGNKFSSDDRNHCYKCDGNSLLHDALRIRGI